MAGRQSVPGLDADWEAFKQLKAAVGNEELTRLKEKAEPHTLFLFENEEIGNV